MGAAKQQKAKKKSTKKKAGKAPVRGLVVLTESGTVPTWMTALRLVLLLCLLAFVAVIVEAKPGRQFFWAAAIPILPVFWILGGYHLWRRICPLALLSQLPRMLGLGGKRRMSGGIGRRYFYLQLGLMFVALSLRLTMTNGTALALAGFLVGVSVLAIAVGLFYTGKTWCNFVCPVGMVEKIYTEPSRIAGPADSRCSPCTACKKNCPDIDLEQGYWKEGQGADRGLAYYAWPGLVFGLYSYYYLLAGNWHYYFSGDWTREDDQLSRILSGGVYFFDGLPIALAAPLCLLVCALVSVAIFTAVEAMLGRVLGPDSGVPGRNRHNTLVIAGFVGFVVFYRFGGRPVLALAPFWVTEFFWVLVLVAGTTMFWLRLRRREQDFVQERFAQKLLKKWQWGEKPASNRLQDIYLVHSERSRERESRLNAYAETIREMVHDGVITRGELVIMDSLRAQLGISDREHNRILAELDEEDRLLFDPEHQGSIEERLQLEQYRRELVRAAMVLVRGGEALTADALEEVREHHNLSSEQHEACVAELRDEDGPLAELLEREIGELRILADALANPAREREDAGYEFLRALAQSRAHQRIDLLFDLLHAVRGGQPLEPLRHALASSKEEERSGALGWLEADGGSAGRKLAAVLRRLYGEDGAEASGPPEPSAEQLIALCSDSSPYLRAVAIHLLAKHPSSAARDCIQERGKDESELVRETVERVQDRGAAGKTLEERGLESLTGLEKMMVLRRVPLLARLEPEDLDPLSRFAQETRFAAGEILCREGDKGDELFLILDGQVRIWRGGGECPTELGRAGRGACIGELAVLRGGVRAATVEAEEPTRALVLAGVEFRTLLLQRPALAEEIIMVLVQRIQEAPATS